MNAVLLLATLLTIYPVVESQYSEKPNSVCVFLTKWQPLRIFQVSVKRIWVIFG